MTDCHFTFVIDTCAEQLDFLEMTRRYTKKTALNEVDAPLLFLELQADSSENLHLVAD